MSFRHCRTAAGTALAVLALASAGCEISSVTGRATDTISHSYPLTAGGEVRVANTNGRVEVESTDGSTVDVSIERIARAATDGAARELLNRIKVTENVTPERIELRTESLGMMIGAGFEVRYHVRAPRGASVSAHTTNGAVTVSGTTGPLDIETRNGTVMVRDASGGVHGGTTNGSVTVELSRLTAPIQLSTTNGRIDLSLPRQAKADIRASVTNGRVDVSDLTMEGTAESPRRFEGRLNGGGTPVELQTTNGTIRIHASS